MSEHTPTQPRTRFFSLRWKLLIGFTVLFSLVFAAAFYWFYSFSTSQALDMIQQDLKNTIKGALKNLDTEALVSLVREGVPNDEGFSDDPRYGQILAYLDLVHEVEPRAWLYTAVLTGKSYEISFGVDLYAKYEKDKALPFRFVTDEISDDAKQALDSGELQYRLSNGNFEIYEDEFGQWVSAYAPIRDKNGATIGLMGIDFVANYVNEVRQGILNSVVGAFAIVYSILFILVFLVSNTFTRPMAKLTDAARAIGEGNYEQDLSQLTGGKVRDEINTLAQVFTIMVGKVYQREQTLRRQVEELKIEIDEVKRSKQLSEIVDTDFFRELQVKAKFMRQRSRGGQADEEGAPTPTEE